jgi:hypothetical protein
MRAHGFGIGLAVLVLAPPLGADEAKPRPVPYTLTNTKHVLVRAKINGKGPYNFIIDTGAPALFVSTAVCKKLGIKPDEKGWGTFDRFEIEGGVVIEKARGRIEDPFQLEGMNNMGLAGAELHGIIGYNLLAKYRMEFDFTKDKMVWTLLPDFEPPAPMGLDGKAGAGVDAMAGLVKVMALLVGKRPMPELVGRGFLGIELAEADGALIVKAVLDKGPAATAGVKVGDRITHFQDKEVKSLAELHTLAAKLPVGETAKLKVTRGSETHEITFKAGEGL